MLKIGGRLKKYNKCNSNLLLIGVLIPILIFFAIINITYAYFTAHTAPFEGGADSGIVIIKLNEAPTTKISEGAVTSSRTSLLPGDTFSVCGTIENGGTTAVYVLFELKITIKKSGPNPRELVVHDFYTIKNNKTEPITITDNGDGTVSYSATAFSIECANDNKTNEYQKDFEVSYTFDGASYNNEYQNAVVTYELHITAIQKDALEDSNHGTQLLIQAAADCSYASCETCNPKPAE